jgi:hypothetical protein
MGELRVGRTRLAGQVLVALPLTEVLLEGPEAPLLGEQIAEAVMEQLVFQITFLVRLLNTVVAAVVEVGTGLVHLRKHLEGLVEATEETRPLETIDLETQGAPIQEEAVVAVQPTHRNKMVAEVQTA